MAQSVDELEVVGVGLQGAFPVFEQGERPVLCDASVRVLLPAVDVRPAPRHAPVLRIDELVELVVYVLADVERTVAVLEQQPEETQDVPDTTLGEVDDAAVDDDVRVRSVQAEQIGETRNGDTEVGARIAVPLLVQFDAAATDD